MLLQAYSKICPRLKWAWRHLPEYACNQVCSQYSYSSLMRVKTKAFGCHFLFFARGRQRLYRALRSFSLRRINLNQRKSEVNNCIVVISHIYLSAELSQDKESFFFRSNLTKNTKFSFGVENLFHLGTAIYKMSCFNLFIQYALFAINKTDKIWLSDVSLSHWPFGAAFSTFK